MIKKKGFPKEDELVLIKVRKISQFAAWGDLLEYDFSGMIHINEAAGKWIGDVREVIKLGKIYVCKVMRIDEEKKVAILSLKRVSKYEEIEKMESYRRELKAWSILRKVGKILGIDAEKVYKEIGEKILENYPEIYQYFEKVKEDFSLLDKIKISLKMKKALKEAIKSSFAKKEIKIKGELEIRSFESDGIERIKKALQDIESKGFEVKYISAPIYRIEKLTTNPKKEEKNLIDVMKNVSKKFNGSYKILK